MTQALQQSSARLPNKQMKISMICFTLTGQQTGEKLKKALEGQGHTVSLCAKSRYLPESIKESTKEWAGEAFERADGIVFIGAAGIAVRSIAPYVAGKKTDPAVLVTDECGRFVISLLSGHLGGANDFALNAAEALQAVPVITTATDIEGKFAVDVFAKKNNCQIFQMTEAKEVSAALLAGEKVGFYSEFPWEGRLPEGLINCSGSALDAVPKVGVAVTIHKDCKPFLRTTHVVPPAVILGMGCRKNKEARAVEKAAFDLLQKKQIYPQAVACLASIDIKKEEPGLLALAKKMGIPFETFSSEELLMVEGEFTASSFVSKTVGVDNVCERSALRAAQERSTRNHAEPNNGQGREKSHLIQKKQAADGVTAALALEEWRIRFE